MTTSPPDWDRKFSRDELTYGHRPNAFLRAHAHQVLAHHGSVLSLGEGEGRNGVWLARHGWQVRAVDRSAQALTKLRRWAATAGVHIDTVCDDVARFLPEPAAWDAVVLLHMHLPPTVRRRVHRRAAEALRPGGVLLLEALRPAQLDRATSGPDDPAMLYRAADLRADFEPLQIKLLECEDRHIDAGEHQGLTSVVHLIARRPA